MNPRGWCPGVYQPMQSGDGLLVRVKPFGGRLPRAALRALADAAEAYGNGIVELTSRGNLQIRGLRDATAAPFAAAMCAAGLADPDPAREQRRNVITLPPHDDTLCAEIEAVMSDATVLAPKFCVAIGAAEADVVVLAGEIITAAGTAHYCRASLAAILAQAGNRRLPTNAPQADPPLANLLSVPHGRTDAAGLRRLAEVTGDARTTPYRAFYVPGALNAAAPAAIACAGAPDCASGTTPTRRDADWLTALGITNVHVSGCAKGCAHHRPAATLVGRAGRYDLVRHGLASDPPNVTGLTIEQAAACLA